MNTTKTYRKLHGTMHCKDTRPCVSTVATSLIIALIMMVAGFTSCDDWNIPQPVEIDVKTPKEQNPELWAHYMDVLKNYKQSKHFIVYGRFNNGAEKPAGAGQLLRSMPDSLDVVSLVNADKMTGFDRADIAVVQEKSTKVLYCVNFAAKSAELSDAGKLGAFLDKAVADAAELNMDGFSFTGIPLYGGSEAERAWRKEAAKLIVQKLSAVAGAGKEKLLVFEGNPAFVAEEDIAKLSYVALDTEKTGNITDLKLQVSLALSHKGLSKDKLLLTALPDGEITNEENVKKPAIAELTDRVAALGPLAGMAIADIDKDYYDPAKSYSRTRQAIRLMNP